MKFMPVRGANFPVKSERAPGGRQEDRWRRSTRLHAGLLPFGARALLPAVFFPGPERQTLARRARVPALQLDPTRTDQLPKCAFW